MTTTKKTTNNNNNNSCTPFLRILISRTVLAISDGTGDPSGALKGLAIRGQHPQTTGATP